jgi:anti-sigma regulatory factor (Ser/Thr protein kinase)
MSPAVNTPSTPTATVGVDGAFRHEALFYSDPAEYLAMSVPFVEAGLARGEPVLIAVPGPNLELLRRELGEIGDQVSYVDMALAGRNPGSIIPYVLHAFLGRYARAGARILAEQDWRGREGAEYPACVQYEALVNLAFAGRDLAMLCPYDVAGLPPEAIADARRTHPVLVEPGTRRPSPAFTEPSALVAAFNKPLPSPPAGAHALAFGRGDLADVRAVVGAAAERFGVSERRRGQLQLAVNEIATNSIIHGNGRGVLRVWYAGGQVVAEVSGGGRLRDPLAGLVPVPPRQPNGRGLLLVNQLCDLVRVYSSAQGTTTRMYLRV